MTEVTNKLNIDSSLMTHLAQITDKMKLDLQQVNNRLNVLEQKVKNFKRLGRQKSSCQLPLQKDLICVLT